MGTKQLLLLIALLITFVRPQDECLQSDAPSKPICSCGQMRSLITISNFVNGTCLFNYKIKFETPSCDVQPPVLGDCQRYLNGNFYCMAEDTFYTNDVDENCQCKTKAIKKLRICCCKEPESYETCDQYSGMKTTVTTSYDLVNDRDTYSCAAVVKKTKTQLDFVTQYSTKVGSCSTNGIQTNLISKTYLDNCAIRVGFERYDVRICGCSKVQRVKEECSFDNMLITRIFQYVLECCECSCLCNEVLISSTRKDIKCDPPVTTKGDCDYSTRKRLVRTTISTPKGCVCTTNIQETYELCPTCPYKETSRVTSDCCPTTGVETITINYQDVDCKEKTKIEERRCACINPPPPPSKVCEDGMSYTIRNEINFDKNTLQCIIKSYKVSDTITCPPKKVVKGTCGKERLYFSKQETTEYKPDSKTCICTGTTDIKYIICASPDTVRGPQSCVNNNHLVRTVITYSINLNINNYVEKRVVEDNEVVCTNKVPDKKVRINRCKSIIHTYLSTVKDCKCVSTEVTTPIVQCCLEKPSAVKRCEGQNQKVTIVTRYTINSLQTACVPVVLEFRRIIVCQIYFKESKTRCKNGRYSIKKTYFEVRNCNCVKKHETKTPVVIKCPNANTKTSCDKDTLVKTTTEWLNINCECVSITKMSRTPIQCPEPKIKVGKCDGKTGIQILHQIYYKIYRCKCVASRKDVQAPCPCFRRDKIERLDCLGNRRVVNRLRYKKVNGKCQWVVSESEIEDCACPKRKTVTTCEKDINERSVTTSFFLTVIELKIPVKRCTESSIVKVKPVVCSPDYTITTPCKYHQQSVIKCFYIKVNCACKLVCKTDCLRACDCKRKNNCSLKCIDNKSYKICHRYKNNGVGCGCRCKDISQCAVSTYKEEIPFACDQRLKGKWCTICNVFENNGYYRICTVKRNIKENCKCITKTETTKKLCFCKDNHVSKPFCIRNKIIVDTSSYTEQNNKCVRRVSRYRKDVYCPEAFIITKDQQTLTQYTLVAYKLSTCKCNKHILVATNSKCHIPLSVEKVCFKTRWLFIEHKWYQRSTTNKLFLQVADSPMATFCQEVTKTWREDVLCDKDLNIQWCDLKNKRLTKIRYYYVAENCKCVMKTLRTTGPCTKCAKTVVHRTNCGPSDTNGIGYLDKITTTFELRKDNTCKKHIQHLKEICRCPKWHQKSACLNGELVTTTVSFKLTSTPPCKPQTLVTRKTIYCYNGGKPNKWVPGMIEKCTKPGEYTIQNKEIIEFVSTSCDCIRRSKKEKIDICCQPCKKLHKCINNYNVEETICQYSKDLRCLTTTTRYKSDVVCPKENIVKVGKPVNCLQSYIQHSHTVQNCQCVKVTKDIKKLVCCIPASTEKRQCEGNRWKITKTVFHLSKDKCEPHIRITYETLPTNELHHETFVDHIINKCTFLRSYYNKKIVNCQYKRHLIRKETLNHRCCSRDKVITSCKDNKILVKVRHFFVLFKFHCLRRTSRTEVKIDCSHIILKERRLTGHCTARDTYYKLIHIKCHCRRKIIKVENNEICCWHRRAFSKKNCNGATGVITTVKYRYVLRNHKCVVHEVSRRSERVNCDRKSCISIVGQCIKHNNLVKLYCMKREKCKCLRKLVHKSIQCCKRESRQWKVVGPCKRCFRVTEYFAFIKKGPKEPCKAGVIRRQRRRCCCLQKPKVTTSCIDNIYIKRTVIMYELNEANDSCIRKRNQQLTHIRGCGKKVRKVRAFVERCNSKTGWGRKITEYVQALNCRCVKSRKVGKYPCVCRLAYPTQKRSFCWRNNIIVREVRTAICEGSRIRWVVKVTKTRQINCQRTFIEKGNCYPKKDHYATWIRHVSKVRYRLINCHCIRTEVKRTKEDCKCRKSYQVIRCHLYRKVVTTYIFTIKEGICKRIDRSVSIPITCPKKPKVTISKCVHNTYNIITRRFHLQDCKCRSNTLRERCDCRCPSTRKVRICSKSYIINEIITYWRKINCRCRSYRVVTPHTPWCPKFQRITIKGCKRLNNYGHQVIIIRRLSKNARRCTCVIKQRIKHRICWCKRNVTRTTRCVRHNLLVRDTWVSVINARKNKCDQVRIKRISKVIICKNRPTKRKCDLKTGRYVERIIKCHIENCSEKLKIIKRHGYCKCKQGLKLVKKGRCSGPSRCMRLDTYVRKELKNSMCKDVKVKKTVRCCCHPKKRLRKYCHSNKLYLSTKTLHLVHHLCKPTETITPIPIVCPSKIIVKEGKCRAGGFKRIIKFTHRIKRCKCVLTKLEDSRCRCRCSGKRVKHSCDRVARVRTKTLISFFVHHCRCSTKVRVIKTPISCPKDSVVVHPCKSVRGHGYYLRKTIITKHKVNEKCKCVSKRYVKEKICCCKRNERVKKTCNRIMHYLSVLKIFTILRDNRCVKKSEMRRYRVKCGSGHWVLKGDSRCVPHHSYGERLLTYVRQRLFRCTCKEEVKTVRCQCICNRPHHKRICFKNRIKHIYYSYRLIKCRCQRSARVRWRNVVCKPLPPIILPCRRHHDGSYRVYTVHRITRVRHCKCHIRRKQEWRICKCPRAFTVKRCDRNTNKIIRTKYWFDRHHKECRRQMSITTHPVACDLTPDCKIVRKCTGKKKELQTVICKFRRLRNCICKVTKSRIVRRCRCKRTRKNKGRCDLRTCFRKISFYKYILVIHRDNKTNCVRSTTIRKERCCCRRKTKKTTECRGNKLLSITEAYIFNRKIRKCKRSYTAINVTPKCHPAKQISKGKCSNRPTCIQNVRITLKSMKHCKCKVEHRNLSKKCCCPEDYVKKICVGINRLVIQYHRFTLHRGKCNKNVIREVVIIRCPTTSIRYLAPCDPVKRTRVLRIISYRNFKCRCIKTIKNIERICRCHDPITRKNCIRNSVIQHTFIWYTLYRRINMCKENKRVTERQIYCKTNPKEICRPCRLMFKSGRYSHCTKDVEFIKSCRCYRRFTYLFKLCECPKPTRYRICVRNNQKITKEIYFEKVRSGDKYHDFVCVRRIRFINPRKIHCPKFIVKSGACINRVRSYQKIYYIKVNCTCIMRIKTYRVICLCDAPKTVNKVCLHNDLKKITIRTFKLTCNSEAIPVCNCNPSIKVHSKRISCPKSFNVIGRCKNGLRIITIVKFKKENCICKRKTKHIKTNCKECVFEVPYCKKIKQKGLCKNDLYFKHLCQFTCRYCERCSNKCYSKNIGKCICKEISGVKICRRKIRIVQHKIFNRKCVARTYIRHAVCGCTLTLTRPKCEKLKKEGRCKDIQVMRKCEHVCQQYCQRCRGSITQKTCVQDGIHKGSFKVIIVFFRAACHLCLTKTSVSYEGKCIICDKTVHRAVTDCVHGSRFVLTYYVIKEKRHCVNKIIRKAYSCKYCCPSIETKIGNCSNGRRTVLTIFWANVNNCCKKQILTNIYLCNIRCSKVSYIKTQCVNGRQIGIKIWRSGPTCKPHRVLHIGSCLPNPK